MTDATQPRLWSGLGLTATLVLAAVPVIADQTHDHGAVAIQLAQAEGGEGGEGGESGEAGEAGAMAVEDAGLALITGIGLMEGHLRSGMELYRMGRADLAITHMKHPQDEIYTDLLPLMEEAGIADFAADLSALADAVETGAPVDTAAMALDALIVRFDTIRADLTDTPAVRLAAMTAMLRTAADEYGIGVVDGAIANLHEYQDAAGFVAAVRADATLLAGSADAVVAAAGAEVLTALSDTDAAFAAGLVPEGAMPTDGVARLSGAAARTELVGLALARQ